MARLVLKQIYTNTPNEHDLTAEKTGHCIFKSHDKDWRI